jgi:hypothetical protein
VSATRGDRAGSSRRAATPKRAAPSASASCVRGQALSAIAVSVWGFPTAGWLGRPFRDRGRSWWRPKALAAATRLTFGPEGSTGILIIAVERVCAARHRGQRPLAPARPPPGRRVDERAGGGRRLARAAERTSWIIAPSLRRAARLDHDRP